MAAAGEIAVFALFSTPSATMGLIEGTTVRGQPMIARVQDITRVLLAVLSLGAAGAAAQTTQSSAQPDASAAPQSASTAAAQTDARPANPAGPQIDKAEITARANRDVGVNIETTIAGWQRELMSDFFPGLNPRFTRPTCASSN